MVSLLFPKIHVMKHYILLIYLLYGSKCVRQSFLVQPVNLKVNFKVQFLSAATFARELCQGALPGSSARDLCEVQFW